MRLFLLLPLLLGFSVPAIAHNEFNGGDGLIPGPLVNDGDAMHRNGVEGEGALINNGTVGSNTDQ